jgi:hypothetical protein
MKEDLQIDYDTTLFDQCIKNYTDVDLSNIWHTTKSTDLAIQAVDKTECTWQEQVPKEYHCFGKIFDEIASHRFPPKRPWDHAIDLLLDAPDCDELCSPPFIKRHVTQDQDPHVTQKAQQSCQKPIHPCILPIKPAAPSRDLSNPKTTYTDQMCPQVPSTKARTTLHDHPQLISLYTLQGPLLAFTTPLHLCAHLATHTIGVSIYDRLNLKVWCPAKACMTWSNPPYSPDQLEEEDDTFSITWPSMTHSLSYDQIRTFPRLL